MPDLSHALPNFGQGNLGIFLSHLAMVIYRVIGATRPQEVFGPIEVYSFEPARNAINWLCLVYYLGVGASMYEVGILKDLGIELGAFIDRKLVYILEGLGDLLVDMI